MSVSEHDHLRIQKEKAATDLLKLMFPETYTSRWNVQISGDTILYCEGNHENFDECQLDSVIIARKTPERYRHKKRGSDHTVKNNATLQVEPDTVLKDGDTMIVYASDDDGRWWIRHEPEFTDGRFEYIKPQVHAPNSENPVLHSHLFRLLHEEEKAVREDHDTSIHTAEHHALVTTLNIQRLELLHRVRKAAELDRLLKTDIENATDDELREMKMTAMWNVHRLIINPFQTYESVIPKGRKDVRKLYGAFLDAIETIDGSCKSNSQPHLDIYPDDELNRMPTLRTSDD